MGGPLGAIIGRYPSAAGGDEQLGGSGGGGIIRHDRRCRDIAFLVLFAAFWVAMIVNSSFGFNQGNPLRSARFAPLPLSLSGSALALPSWVEAPRAVPVVVRCLGVGEGSLRLLTTSISLQFQLLSPL
jgi:hypothetical protein